MLFRKKSKSDVPSITVCDGARCMFRYVAPQAKAVFVAGSFNNWTPQAIGLEKGRDGAWQVSLPLEPGRHEYRFVVDGEWCNDQFETESAPNGHGGTNSVVRVSSR